ncbi:hypothetical protein DSECCO2_550550 [anaerobic digester metagenome]
MAEEEGQDQGADVRPVHVGIGHDDDLVVAQTRKVHVVLADAGTHGRDESLDLLVLEHLVEAGLLHVQDLAAQGQDGLELGVAALLGRAAGRVALDDEDFALGRVLALAVGQLARQGVVGQGALAADQLLGAAGRVAGAGRVDDLLDDQPHVLGVLAEEFVQFLVDDGRHVTGHLGVAELGLGLALELRVGDLDADDGRQALAHVVARDLLLELLGQVGAALDVGVDGAGQGRLEALQVGAAFAGADVVGEGVHVLLVPGRVLQGEVDAHALHLPGAADDAVDAVVQVLVLDEERQAAVVLEHVAVLGLLVEELDLDAGIEVGELLEALGQHVVLEVELLEDLLVRPEAHQGAGLVGLADHGQGRLGHAAHVALVMALAAAADRDLQVLGQGVDHGHAHAVQAARHLVGVVVELAARVQHGHDHFQGRLLLLGVHVHGNAAAVVDDAHGVVHVHRDLDMVAVPGHGLVDGVVDDLVDEVVQAVDVGRADVHGRPHADGGQAFEDGDVVRGVCRCFCHKLITSFCSRIFLLRRNSL